MFSKTVTRNLHDVVIVSAARTPMGSFQSALSSFSAPQLGSIAIAEAVKVTIQSVLSGRFIFKFSRELALKEKLLERVTLVMSAKPPKVRLQLVKQHWVLDFQKVFHAQPFIKSVLLVQRPL